jgi:hypothetical protein
VSRAGTPETVDGRPLTPSELRKSQAVHRYARRKVRAASFDSDDGDGDDGVVLSLTAKQLRDREVHLSKGSKLPKRVQERLGMFGESATGVSAAQSPRSRMLAAGDRRAHQRRRVARQRVLVEAMVAGEATTRVDEQLVSQQQRERQRRRRQQQQQQQQQQKQQQEWLDEEAEAAAAAAAAEAAAAEAAAPVLNRHALARVLAARRRQAAPAHARETDIANCTHEPRRTAAQRASARAACYDFTDRMEAEAADAREKGLDRQALFVARAAQQQRHAEDAMRQRRGQLEYDDLHDADKRSCPRCGAVQSFDELDKRKKNCQGCATPFIFRGTRALVSGHRHHHRHHHHHKAKPLHAASHVDVEVLVSAAAEAATAQAQAELVAQAQLELVASLHADDADAAGADADAPASSSSSPSPTPTLLVLAPPPDPGVVGAAVLMHEFDPDQMAAATAVADAASGGGDAFVQRQCAEAALRERRRRRRVAEADARKSGAHGATSKARLRTRTAKELESKLAFRRCGGTPAEPITEPASFVARSRIIELVDPMYGAEPRDGNEARALARLVAERQRQERASAALRARQRVAEAERKGKAARAKQEAVEAHRRHLRSRHVVRRNRIECLVLQDPECTFAPDTSSSAAAAQQHRLPASSAQDEGGGAAGSFLSKTVDGNVPWRGI